MTTSEQVRAALAVEWAKFRWARPVWVTTVLLTTGVVAMCVLTLRSVHGADATMAGKAQAIVEDGGRAGLFAAADTIVSVGGLLGFGVVVGWVFGREFTDGAISGLWAAPVSRPAVAAAKLLILLTWSVAVSVATGAALAVAGTFVDDDPLVPGTAALVGRFLAVALLTAGLAVPCAWVATVARGYLPAIGTIIAVVIAAQMAVMTGAGGWFPFSAPGLWAAGPQAGSVTAPQLALALTVPVVSAGLTLWSWRRLSLVHQ
ncbi:MAG: ABC transporter permease [Rhodococcus sp. (in: high G+C Gram-positive bacteria)]|nr:ABC transporter permease [Rhodococcus sp. (in: high G+C Gram-positive bacteria)]MDX5454980.1 ABC transporter permease [Rhodococcus sp. (in: high G+C Gram-positive bacteria)]